MRKLLLVLLLPFIATCASQKDAYFPPQSIPATAITPPVEVHGAAWNADIATIRKAQTHPDPAAVEQARAERDLAPEMVAQAVMPELTRQGYPKMYALLDRVSETSEAITSDAKHYWHTQRPYLMDSHVKALIQPHSNASYPSGHTTGSLVWAEALSELMPEKRDAFMTRANEIAQHRVLAGMHYPHDLAGGRELALVIYGGLLQNAEYNVDVEAAKQELQRKQ